MDTQTVCRICKTEGVRLHCITNTYLQETYEHDTGILISAEDIKPLLACITCCDRLQHYHQARSSCEQRENALTVMVGDDEQHSNTNLSAIPPPPVEHHYNTCAVQSDVHKCIKMEPEHFIEIELKQECTTNGADETWPLNDVSREEDNEDAEIGQMPKIITVKSENRIEIEIQPYGISTNEKQAPRRVTQRQNTTSHNKELTEEKADGRSCGEVTFYNYNNDACELGHHVKNDTSFCTYNISNNISVNPGKQRFECDVCHKHFKVKSNLLRHISIHSGDKPYQCNICSKLFTQKSDLGKHNRIHTGEKPYKCDICNKCFSQKCNLITHHNHVHSGYKPYECNTCNKCFSEKSNLVAHRRIHTGDKPNKCNICSKRFTQKNDLVKHIRLHTGEKPYKCNICGKCFTEKGSLVRHSRIHTGEKPYECNICDKSFNQKSSLVSHRRIHTDR